MKRAIALRYDETVRDAPYVVSSAEGGTAEVIERAARDYGIAVVRDGALADALQELAVGDSIPEALYEAVAEILREVAGEPQT
jgi:type III secretion system FlhB-like substrate exporter